YGHRGAAGGEPAAGGASACDHLRYNARFAAGADGGGAAGEVRDGSPGGDRPGSPPRPVRRAAEAGAPRRALPRRPQPGAFDRAHQPLSPDQAARTPVNAALENPALQPATGARTAEAPAATLVLRSSEFRKGREASWRELEGFIKEVERRSLLSL